MKSKPPRCSPVWLLVLVVAFEFSFGAPAQIVSQVNTAISAGGRSVAVTINPANPTEALVASESGGLFRTLDGGSSWFHVDALPMFRLIDVAYAPSSPPNQTVVIVTGWGDSSTGNRGGIWRSTDNGLTWSKPATSNPGCAPHAAAWGIAFQPNSPNVYVGTDCGLAVSRDSGATWSHQTPASATGDRWVLAVAAGTGGIIDIRGYWGTMRSIDAATNWLPRQASSPSGWDGVHCLAQSPSEPAVVYTTRQVANTNCTFANASVLMEGIYASDGSVTWRQVSRALCRNGGRGPWIAASSVRTGNSSVYDLYFGTGLDVYRQRVTAGGSGPRASTNAWTQVMITHSDQTGMAFNPSGNCADFMVSDGGVYRPTDRASRAGCGNNWALAGTPLNGFSGLQLYDVAGQINGSSTELYVGTQDNGLWASTAGGGAWRAEGSEGGYLQIPRYGSSAASRQITWTDFGAGQYKIGRSEFAGATVFRSASTNAITSPVVLQPGVYAQWTLTPRPTGTERFTNQLWITSNSGATWASIATVVQELRGMPQISRVGDDAVLYQAARRPGALRDTQEIVGLLRIDGLRMDGSVGTVRVRNADSGLGSIGQFCHGEGTFICPPVWAVDPNDPQQLMAADIANAVMMVSTNGGSAWGPNVDLTSVMTGLDSATGNREFRFNVPYTDFPFVGTFNGFIASPGAVLQPHVIAFDPFQRGHILVGTEAAGIVRTTDAGATWSLVPGSRQITGISSFFFRENTYSDPRNSAYVSTYGRGLWKLRFPTGIRSPFRIDEKLANVWSNEWIRDPSTGGLVDINVFRNPDWCPPCRWLAIAGGQIRGTSRDQSGRLDTVFVDAGILVRSSSDGFPIAAEMRVLQSDKTTIFDGCPACDAIANQGGNIRGLVVDEDGIRAIIAGFGELPGEALLAEFEPPITKPGPLEPNADPIGPYLQMAGDRFFGGTAAAPVGAVVTAQGRGFQPPSEMGPVTLTVGGRVVSSDILPDAEGRWSASFTLDPPVGAYAVHAWQRDPKGNEFGDTSKILAVIAEDEPTHPENRPPKLHLPADFTVATCSGKAEIHYDVRTSSGCPDGGAVLTCTLPSGSVLPVGTHVVQCSATDACAFSSKGSFVVSVVESSALPPELEAPDGFVVECGDSWEFGQPKARDACDGSPVKVIEVGSITKDLCGGGKSHTRVWQAQSANGSSSSISQTIEVRDTKPPVLAYPQPIKVRAESKAGAIVKFAADAKDACDPAPDLIALPASGSVFPIGVTLVSLFATDSCGNQAAGSFTVTVAEPADPPQPPTLTAFVQNGQVLLRWPAEAFGFRLQSSPRTDDPKAWLDVPQQPELDNKEFTIRLPAVQRTEFFRLVQP